MRALAALAVLALSAPVSLPAQTPARPRLPRRFEILQPERPRCLEQQACVIDLRTADGQAPFQWRIAQGKLPAGLALNRDSGRISGSPAAAGVVTVTLAVVDGRSQQAQLRLTITIVSILEIAWQTAPALNASAMNGSLYVINHSGNEVMLTVVVVAVNEINKAFTLGYQHFSIAPGATSPVIPFGMQLPPGRYRVRADAVGEVAPKNLIYRSALQAGPFSTP